MKKLFFSLVLLTSFNYINYNSRTAGHTTSYHPTNSTYRPSTTPTNPTITSASLTTFKTYLAGILTAASSQFGSINNSQNNNNNKRSNNNLNSVITQIKNQIDSLNASMTALVDINSIILSVTMTLNNIKTTLMTYDSTMNNSNNNSMPKANNTNINNNISSPSDLVTKISSYIADFITNITGETNIANLQNYFNGAFNPKTPTATNTKPISVILDYIYNVFTNNESIARKANLIYPFTPNSSYFLSRASNFDDIIKSAINKLNNIDIYLNSNGLSNQTANNDFTIIVLHTRYFELGIDNLDGVKVRNHDYTVPEVRSQANINEIRVALQDIINKYYANSNIFFLEFNSEQYGSMDNGDGNAIAALFGLNDSQDGVDFHPSILIYSNILSKMSGKIININNIKDFIKTRSNATILKSPDLGFNASAASDIYNSMINKLTTTLSSLGIKTINLPISNNSRDLNDTVRRYNSNNNNMSNQSNQYGNMNNQYSNNNNMSNQYNNMNNQYGNVSSQPINNQPQQYQQPIAVSVK